MRVVGERPIVGGNKWSCFDQSYPVPENCEVEKLQGKFEQGTLIITMPKKFPSSHAATSTPKARVLQTTKEKVATSSPKIAKEAIPSKFTTPRVEEEPIGDKKIASSSPRIVKALNDLKGTQKATSPTQRHDKGKLRALNTSEPFEEETVLKPKATTPKEKTSRPQKGQEEIEPPKPTLIVAPTNQIVDEKHQEEIRKKIILETVKKQLLHEKGDHEKESVTKKEVEEEEEEEQDRKSYESRKLDEIKYVDQNMVLKGKEIKARKLEPSPKGEESSASKAAKKEKETSKRATNIDKAKGIKEVAAASTSEVVRRIGEGKLNDQDKPLLANMGAAILVIVALGAYVTYKFKN